MAKRLVWQPARGFVEGYTECKKETLCKDCLNAFDSQETVCPFYVGYYCHRKGEPLPLIRELFTEHGSVVDAAYL